VTDSVVLGALDPDHLYSPLRRRTGRCLRGSLAGLAVLEKLPHRPAAGIYPTRHRRVCLRRCRRAEVSFRCGPLAIHRVMLAVHPDDPHTELITGSRSTPRGFSLNQVEELSRNPASTITQNMSGILAAGLRSAGPQSGGDLNDLPAHSGRRTT